MRKLNGFANRVVEEVVAADIAPVDTKLLKKKKKVEKEELEESAKYYIEVLPKDINKALKILKDLRFTYKTKGDTIIFKDEDEAYGIYEIFKEEKIKIVSKSIDDLEESYELDESLEDYDYDNNGKIDIDDLIYLCNGLSEKMLSEIIDIVADYIEDGIQTVDDGLPTDSFMEVTEGIVRKKVVRNGKRMIIKKSSKAGYKMSSGKETRMSPKEIRNRVKSAKKAARKRKSKASGANRKRALSMKKR